VRAGTRCDDQERGLIVAGVDLGMPGVGPLQGAAPYPLRLVLNWGRRYSLWVFNFGLACCAIEFIAASMARHDFIRLGVIPFAHGPRQADLMITSGTVTDKMAPAVRRLYEQMPEPKYVISFGACSNSGGPYWDSYCVTKGVDQIIPVDVYVPGCPPRPEALLQSIVKLQEKIAGENLGRRYRKRDAGASPVSAAAVTRPLVPASPPSSSRPPLPRPASGERASVPGLQPTPARRGDPPPRPDAASPVSAPASFPMSSGAPLPSPARPASPREPASAREPASPVGRAVQSRPAGRTMTEPTPAGMPAGWPFDPQGERVAPAERAQPRERVAPADRAPKAAPPAASEPTGAADTADLAVPPEAIAAADAARPRARHADSAARRAAASEASPAETVEDTRPTAPPARDTDQDAT
jgi:NADH-quinone oxidoreductase B subunit